MKKKVAFKTLGCRLNQFETDSIVSQFHKGNYEIVDFTEHADVYVVNTCTVTNQGESRSRQAVRFANKQNKNALVVVTGCMVNEHQDHPENLKNATYFIKNEQKSALFSIVDAHLQGEMINPESITPNTFNYKPADKTMHTRAMIKVQDGCDNFCTFCIVPKVRGRATSRPQPEVIDNIKQVLDFGYKEIVLTGVNIGRYDWDNLNFEKLLQSILEIPGDFRVRISSIEPDGYGDHFIDLLQHPKLAPHLHLCLQSGSDKILLQMRRMYSVKEYIKTVTDIRNKIPLFNFTTDVMLGFPGETEEDFQQTIQVVKEIGFSHVHTFKYSIRKGTRAERMDNHISGIVKTERSAIIRKLAEENKLRYRKSLIGVEQSILTERIQDANTAKGYSEFYAPVEISGANLRKNTFYTLKPHDIVMDHDPHLISEIS
jgi:threonylcarbamoyladenosine tRNA methylthiotransferase MtaB